MTTIASRAVDCLSTMHGTSERSKREDGKEAVEVIYSNGVATILDRHRPWTWIFEMSFQT
jgi:hypothetical protein